MCINSFNSSTRHFPFVTQKIQSSKFDEFDQPTMSCDAKCQGPKNEYVVKWYSLSPKFYHVTYLNIINLNEMVLLRHKDKGASFTSEKQLTFISV